MNLTIGDLVRIYIAAPPMGLRTDGRVAAFAVVLEIIDMDTLRVQLVDGIITQVPVGIPMVSRRYAAGRYAGRWDYLQPDDLPLAKP